MQGHVGARQRADDDGEGDAHVQMARRQFEAVSNSHRKNSSSELLTHALAGWTCCQQKLGCSLRSDQEPGTGTRNGTQVLARRLDFSTTFRRRSAGFSWFSAACSQLPAESANDFLILSEPVPVAEYGACALAHAAPDKLRNVLASIASPRRRRRRAAWPPFVRPAYAYLRRRPPLSMRYEFWASQFSSPGAGP